MMSFLVLFVISAVLPYIQTAGGYVELAEGRPKHDVPIAAAKSQKEPRSVPTLSYDYQPTKPRQMNNHNWKHKWERRHGSYYVNSPIAQVPQFEPKPSVIDTIASMERRNNIPTTGVFRTYGKGQVKIPHRGATVHVPKTFGSNKAHRAMISARVFDPPKHLDLEENDVISRSRRDCAGCPKDEMAVASKGHNFVILPEPCSYKWQTISGPKPGTKLPEGIHYITGTMGHRKQVCQYKYQVEVRKCPAIEAENVIVTCNSDNSWGSECNFSCPPKYELKGKAKVECGDDFQWIEAVPTCIETFKCSLPNLENGTKLNCETNELSEVSDEYLPEGSYCRLKGNGSETAMKCRKGEWKKVNHAKRRHRRNKHHKKTNEKSADKNVCSQLS